MKQYGVFCLNVNQLPANVVGSWSRGFVGAPKAMGARGIRVALLVSGEISRYYY
jgi:hypothetical protein